MTVFDLVEMLRMQGFFSLDEVESAILEVNGNLSVRPKMSVAPATPEQLGLKVADAGLPMTVISDGTNVDAGLTFLDKTRDELSALLKEKNLVSGDIFIMTWDRGGNTVIVEKEQAR